MKEVGLGFLPAVKDCFQGLLIDTDFLLFRLGTDLIKSAQRVCFGGCASL